jgi:AcrR family transcriptional regulator
MEEVAQESAAPSLRARQAELAREAILGALVDRLERTAPEDVVLADIARAAGVSPRTLYRYFPTRDDLFRAAGAWVFERLGVDTEIDGGADAIADSHARAARAFDAHPQLARALLRSTVGRGVRSESRERRVASIRAALAEVTQGLDPAEARQAAAVIGHLCSLDATVTLQDEGGLKAGEVPAATTWAITTLIDDLRKRQGKAKRREAK